MASLKRTAAFLVTGGLGVALLGVSAITAGASVVKPNAPKNPSLVSVQKQSSPRVGSVLTAPLDGASATTSLWSGSPKLTIQWYRCVTSTSCQSIPGATKDDETVTSGDVDDYLQAWVTATNSAGTTVVKSPLSPLIRNPLVPADTSLPTISASGVAPLPGVGLHASTGSWTGSPTHYVFEWFSCTSSKRCTVIETGVLSLPTSSTLMVSTADLGDTLEVEVVASNKYGASLLATSRATKPVGI